MIIVIIGFHVMLIVSIILLIVALREKAAAKRKLIESGAGNNNQSPVPQIVKDPLAVEFEALDEKKRAAQLVCSALENVIRSFENELTHDGASLKELAAQKDSAPSILESAVENKAVENKSESEINQ